MAAKKEVFSVELRTGEGLYQTTSAVQGLLAATLNGLPAGLFATKADLAALIASKFQKPGTTVSPENALQNMMTATRNGLNPKFNLQMFTGYPDPKNDAIGVGYGLLTSEEMSHLGINRVETGRAKNDNACLVSPEKFAPRNKIEELVLRLEGLYAPKTNKNLLGSLAIPLDKTEWLASIGQIRDDALAGRLARFIKIYLEPPTDQISSEEQNSIVRRTWPIKGQDIVTALKIAMRPSIINPSRVEDMISAGIIRTTDEETRTITEYDVKELLALIAVFDTYREVGGFMETKDSTRFDSWLLSNRERIRERTTQRLGKDHLLAIILNSKNLQENEPLS